MPNLKNLLPFFLSSALISGCASLSPSEPVPVKPAGPKWNVQTCESTDWYKLGSEQGEKRYIDIDIQKIATRCVRQGVDVDVSEYLRALEEEAKKYCTLDEARALGAEGKAYPTLCRKEVYSEFYYEWHRSGEQYCAQKTEIDRAKNAFCHNLKG